MIDERWIDEEGEGDVCVDFGDLQLKNWIDKARSYLNGFLVRPFVCSPRSASNLEALVCGRITPSPFILYAKPIAYGRVSDWSRKSCNKRIIRLK